MSYILDALRKADAQRERDASRGIHAHPAAPGAESASARAAPRLWAWGVLGAGVALIAAAGWYLMRTPPLSAPAASAPQSIAGADLPPARPAVMLPPDVPSAPAAGKAATAADAISPPPAPRERTTVAAPPMRGLPQTNAVPDAGPGVAESQRAALAREQAFARAAGAAPPPAAPAPAPHTAPAQAAPANGAAPAPAAAATALPPDAPKLAISGGVYSPSPAQRMLIVNGQVFNEGSEVAPGVTVERIQPRTAVLVFRGTRYTVAY